MFWGMGNHLGPFPEASDWPEGQEWDLGGPEPLQRVNFYFSKNKKIRPLYYSSKSCYVEIWRLQNFTGY